jgi:aryl-phospho-beta-D-glucosidase BglC (GH1 family)
MRKFEGFQKGINLGGWISQCVTYSKEHYETFITKADIEQIASWGLDHVRVPVDYDILMDDDMNWNNYGLGYIDNCIAWCKENGINMILDLHKTPGYMFDAQEVENPDLFFEKKELQDSFIEIWKVFAARYGKYSDMLTFELLNEITNPAYAVKWNEIARRAIEAIRELAPDSYIIVGGTRYNNVISVPELDEPYDDKIVYNFHCYEPLVFTHQKAYWVEGMTNDFEMSYPTTLQELRDKSAIFDKQLVGAIFTDDLTTVGPEMFEKLFSAAIKTAEERNVPLYCGEYGVIDQAPLPDTLRWLQDIHSVFEKYGIGRALWNYKLKDFGIVDEHYADIKDEMIKNL